MKVLKVASLVEDFSVHVRNSVSEHNIRAIAEAMRAGVKMPPAITERGTRRIVDGICRARAKKLIEGDDAEIEVVERTYKSDFDFFLDSARMNASHGLQLNSCDHVHCLLVAERLSIPIERVARALNITAEKLGALRPYRTATTATGLTIPIKQTIRHMAGHRLNRQQCEVNAKLSGMNQVFYANQLIMLIESKLLDLTNETLVERLGVLQEQLNGILVAVS